LPKLLREHIIGGSKRIVMSANELLNYYESVVDIDSQILEQDNPVLREYVLQQL